MDSQKISIENKEYCFNLKISKRARYIRLQYCSERGLELIIPQGIPISEAEAFVRAKKDWVAKYINQPPREENQFYFLGQKLNVKHDYDLYTRKTVVRLEDDALTILSPERSKSGTRGIYQQWLAIKARQYIIERVGFLSEAHGFKVRKVSIKGQKTRWGSCSRFGNLTFNFKLMAYAPEVIDYVIIHELCHLIELNHSARFWRQVESILPNYKELRKELRKIK